MPARVEVFSGLVFVNLDPDAAPLADGARRARRAARARTASSGLERFTEATTSQPANWKIVSDNYLEGYHVPIAHPSLMRLLDYQHYTVEVGDGYVWFEAPLRAKPSGNRLERAYQRMVRPMPGLTDADRSVWRYIWIWPNTAIDLYPDQVMTWQVNPKAIDATHDVWDCYRAEKPTAAMRAVQRLNHRLNNEVAEEDAELVARVQAGMRTTGWTARTAGRARGRGRLVRRPRAARAGGDRVTAPARVAGDARERILEAACDVIAEHGIEDVRIARIATAAGVSPPLVHYHFETREALLGEALEHSFELLGDFRTTRGRGRGLDGGAEARLDDRPVAAVRRPGRPRVAAVAGAVGPRGAPGRAQAGRGAPVRALRRVDRRGGRGGHRDGRVPHGRRARGRAAPVAAIDGVGLRVLVDDPAMELEHARRLVVESLAAQLGADPGAFDPRGGS